jgi:hypothetical protein
MREEMMPKLGMEGPPHHHPPVRVFSQVLVDELPFCRACEALFFPLSLSVVERMSWPSLWEKGYMLGTVWQGSGILWGAVNMSVGVTVLCAKAR